MTNSQKPSKCDLLLEAEVAPKAQSRFEKRYMATTQAVVVPGKPRYYQNQPNKWGTELRVYFNDPGMAISLEANGVHVEYHRRGYKSGKYHYRTNDNKLWWKLVKDFGLRLGEN